MQHAIREHSAQCAQGIVCDLCSAYMFYEPWGEYDWAPDDFPVPSYCPTCGKFDDMDDVVCDGCLEHFDVTLRLPARDCINYV